MTEFIVWDKVLKYFMDDDLNISKDGELIRLNKWGESDCLDIDNLSVHNYIGKKDSNDNKIYADSSIVEFVFKDSKTSENVKLKGFFTWNDEDLRYEIDILNDSDYICLNYRIDLICNMKIIDTIQENKLGLIK